MNGGAGDSTVWLGTAFNGCDDIILLHLRFGSNITAQKCNNGHITLTAQSRRAVENTSYISTLEVLVNPGHDDMPMKTIKCVHDNGIAVIDSSLTIINTSIVCMPSEILNVSATDNTTSSKGKQIACITILLLESCSLSAHMLR